MHTRGFTLMEMLVVILVVGILAAVAVPQLQLVLWKTRYARLLLFGRQLAKAVEFRALEQGSYPVEPELQELLPEGFEWEGYKDLPGEGVYRKDGIDVWCAGGAERDENGNKLKESSCRLIGLNFNDFAYESMGLFVNAHVDDSEEEDSPFAHSAACWAMKIKQSPRYGFDHAVCKGLGGKLSKTDWFLYWL